MEEFLRVIFSIGIGIILGTGLNFAICSSKGLAKQAIFGVGGGSIILVIGNQAAQVVDMKVEYTHVVMLFTALITCALWLNRFISTLRKKCPDLPMDISYLVSTDSKLSQLYDSYIESQKSAASKEVEFKRREENINETQKKLDIKEKALTEQEKIVSSAKTELKEQAKSGFVFELPYKKSIPLSESLLESLPKYFEHVINFLNSTGAQFELITNQIDSGEAIPQEVIINTGLSIIASSIRRDLIQDSSARVMFRAFNGTCFEAIAVDSRSRNEDKVSKIPQSSESMITQVGKYKRSLVKSINPEFDLCINKSSERWSDYITFPFEQYIDGDIPLLTMNISVKNQDKNLTNYLKFLSMIRFELVIDEFLEVVDEAGDLKSYLQQFKVKEVA